MGLGLPDGLVDALEHPGRATYCWNCDGYRTHATWECPHPDPFRSLRYTWRHPRRLAGDLRARWRKRRAGGAWMPGG